MSQTTPQTDKTAKGDDNEHGEGNRAADREYREDVQRFMDAGRVGPASREASRALDDDDEREELEQAERIGKSGPGGARAVPPDPSDADS